MVIALLQEYHVQHWWRWCRHPVVVPVCSLHAFKVMTALQPHGSKVCAVRRVLRRDAVSSLSSSANYKRTEQDCVVRMSFRKLIVQEWMMHRRESWVRLFCEPVLPP